MSPKNCLSCGTQLFPGTRAHYCSSACRVSAFRRRRRRHLSITLSQLLSDLSLVTPLSLRSSLIGHVCTLKDLL